MRNSVIRSKLNSLPFIATHKLIARCHTQSKPQRNRHIPKTMLRYDNIHAFNDNNLRNTITSLKSQNATTTTFLNVYQLHNISKTKRNSLGLTYTDTFYESISTPSTKNTFNSKTTPKSVLKKFTLTVSNTNKNTRCTTEENVVNEQDNSGCVYDKEYDMIFKNSEKKFMHLEKKVNLTADVFKENKYSQGSIEKFNSIYEKLAFLSGSLNYIYPKLFLMRKKEEYDRKKRIHLNQQMPSARTSRNKRNPTQVNQTQVYSIKAYDGFGV